MRNRLFVALGATLLFGPLALSIPWATPLRAQTATAPAFEVASIKPHVGQGRVISLDTTDPGIYRATNASVKRLIEYAYGMQDFQVSGGPTWVETERFDIEAKIEDSLADQLRDLSEDQQGAQKKLMLQALLADRFGLKLVRETKQLSAYTLVVAKGGAKLGEVQRQNGTDLSTDSTISDLPLGGWQMSMSAGQSITEARVAGIAALTTMLSRRLQRPVIDQTGLKGTYDFKLQYAAETGLDGKPLAPPGNVAEDDEPSLFSAIQEQLGLRLESIKAPFETVAIDHVEQPSAN